MGVSEEGEGRKEGKKQKVIKDITTENIYNLERWASKFLNPQKPQEK